MCICVFDFVYEVEDGGMLGVLEFGNGVEYVVGC